MEIRLQDGRGEGISGQKRARASRLSPCRSSGHRRIIGAENAHNPARMGRVRVEDKKMSDKIYEVPAEWKKRAYIDDAKYKEMYQRSLADPDALLGRTGQAHPLDAAISARSRTPPSPSPTSRSNGSRTARPTSPTTASTAICTRAAIRPRSSGKATIRKIPSTSPIRNCTTRSAASPISCATATSRRATASPSTCR